MSHKVIDRTEQRFGRLLVIEQVPNILGLGAWWSCMCDCGKTIEGQRE